MLTKKRLILHCTCTWTRQQCTLVYNGIWRYWQLLYCTRYQHKNYCVIKASLNKDFVGSCFLPLVAVGENLFRPYAFIANGPSGDIIVRVNKIIYLFILIFYFFPRSWNGGKNTLQLNYASLVHEMKKNISKIVYIINSSIKIVN